MRHFSLIAFAFAAACSAQENAPPATADGWVDLLDVKLSRWEVFMGSPHESVQGLPPGTPVSKDGVKGVPLGLNNDPKHVFSMITQKGEPVLFITGEIYGGLSTLAEFENYHVRLETKWGAKIWEPRPTKPRDSGLLIHCTGPHGASFSSWMACLEFQIQENDLGDLYCLAGPSAKVPGVLDGKKWVFKPGGDLAVIGDAPDKKSGMAVRSVNHERKGEWNVAEVYTFGDRAIFLVNGKVVNVLLETKIKTTNGLKPLVRGKLQLQSEASEVYYRRMKLRPISVIPEEVLTQAGLAK